MNLGLRDVIPAKHRKTVYSVFLAIGVLLGAIQVGFAAPDGAGEPEWVATAIRVYSYLAIAGFGLSVSNTPAPLEVSDDGELYVPQHRRDEAGQADVVRLLAIAVLVLLVALLAQALVAAIL